MILQWWLVFIFVTIQGYLLMRFFNRRVDALALVIMGIIFVVSIEIDKPP
jgi:hypothetical protein